MLRALRWVLLFYATAPCLGLAVAVLTALGMAIAKGDPYLAIAATLSGLLGLLVAWLLVRWLW
jgi:hypothetical protein